MPAGLQDAGSGTPVWLSLLLVLIPLAGVILTAVLVRRTGRETVAGQAETLANEVAGRIDTRLASLELDKWRRREETMRMLRWAAEQATKDGNDDAAVVGTRVLDALGQSELLQPEDQLLIDAVLDALLEQPESEYLLASSNDDSVEVDLVGDDVEDGPATRADEEQR